jgi:hypothetical protein
VSNFIPNRRRGEGILLVRLDIQATVDVVFDQYQPKLSLTADFDVDSTDH